MPQLEKPACCNEEPGRRNKRSRVPQRRPDTAKKTQTNKKTNLTLELPSVRLDSALPLQGAQVLSLVGKLRAHMPRGVAKKIKINK